MKKNLIFVSTLLIMFTSFAGQAQEPFSRRYDFSQYAAVLTGLVITDSCYYAVGPALDTNFILYGRPGNVFVKFALNGDVLESKVLSSPYRSFLPWEPTFYPTPDGNFIVTAYSYDALLIKYAPNGDTLLAAKYPNPFEPGLYINPKDMKQTSSGGFAIVNEINNPESNGNSYVDVMLIDSTYQPIWRQTIGGANYWEIPYSILADEDGGFTVGARITNQPLIDIYFTARDHIFKLDSLGNILWEYKTPLDQKTRGVLAMLRTSDGGLFVASGKGVEIQNNFYGELRYQHYFYKLSPDREFEWGVDIRDKYHYTWNDIEKIIETADGDGYVAVGRIYERTSDTTWNRSGLITKISPNGDSLWAHYYTIVDDLWDQHKFFDIKEAPDGGFVICGEASGYYWDTTQTYQQGWLLKVDEWGCLVPGCHLTNQTDDPLQAHGQLFIYPNPATDYLNFYYRSPVFNKNKGSFSVLDANGRLIREFATDRNDATFILPVHDWPAGVYFLQYREEGQLLATERFVVHR